MSRAFSGESGWVEKEARREKYGNGRGTGFDTPLAYIHPATWQVWQVSLIIDLTWFLMRWKWPQKFLQAMKSSWLLTIRGSLIGWACTFCIYPVDPGLCLITRTQKLDSTGIFWVCYQQWLDGTTNPRWRPTSASDGIKRMENQDGGYCCWLVVTEREGRRLRWLCRQGRQAGWGDRP